MHAVASYSAVPASRPLMQAPLPKGLSEGPSAPSIHPSIHHSASHAEAGRQACGSRRRLRTRAACSAPAGSKCDVVGGATCYEFSDPRVTRFIREAFTRIVAATARHPTLPPVRRCGQRSAAALAPHPRAHGACSSPARCAARHAAGRHI